MIDKIIKIASSLTVYIIIWLWTGIIPIETTLFTNHLHITRGILISCSGIVAYYIIYGVLNPPTPIIIESEQSPFNKLDTKPHGVDMKKVSKKVSTNLTDIVKDIIRDKGNIKIEIPNEKNIKLWGMNAKITFPEAINHTFVKNYPTPPKESNPESHIENWDEEFKKVKYPTPDYLKPRKSLKDKVFKNK